MENIYSREGYVETLLNDGIITVRWKKMFNSTIIRESCEAQLAKVKEGKAKVIVADVVNASGKPSDEMQNYFSKELFPAYQQHGLKALITVKPKNPLTAAAAERWQMAGKPFGFDMFETNSLIMARKKAREIIA